MKKFTVCAVIAALGCAASVASAQEQGRVLSSKPVYQQVPLPYQVCRQEEVYTGNRTSGGGAVLGAIAGGAAGNAIGSGSGRSAATALGIVGGAILGNQIEGNGQPQYQTVERCTNQTRYENRTIGYDVVYEYAGKRYTTRTQNDPGRWIALTVQPDGYTTLPAPSNGAYSTEPEPLGYEDARNGYVEPGVVVPSPYAPPAYAPAPVYSAPSYAAPVYVSPPPAYYAPPLTIIQYDRGRPHYRHPDRYDRGYNDHYRDRGRDRDRDRQDRGGRSNPGGRELPPQHNFKPMPQREGDGN
jgi:uncharacterized protein YcfJ